MFQTLFSSQKDHPKHRLRQRFCLLVFFLCSLLCLTPCLSTDNFDFLQLSLPKYVFLICGYFFLLSTLASSSHWCRLFESSVCSYQCYSASSAWSQPQRMVLLNTLEPGVLCKSLFDTVLSVTSRCVSGMWVCNSVPPPVTEVSWHTSFVTVFFRCWIAVKARFTSSGLVLSLFSSRLLCSWTLFSVQLHTATYTYA